MIVSPGRQARTAADAEMLFKEARRRRRRRRVAGAAVSLVLAGSAAAGITIGGRQHHDPARTSGTGRPAGPRQPVTARLTMPAVRLAWVDTSGQLHVGDPATGARHAGPVTDASPSWPPVSAGGHLYWSDSSKEAAPIREYDLATRRIRYLARGESVFASADGRHLYIAASSTRLIELRGNGSGPPAVLPVPAGWHVSGDQAVQWDGPVAGGILVYSRTDPGYRQSLSTREGIWDPATGRVRVIGTGDAVLGAYTPPRARYSLLAAIPGRTWAEQNGPAFDIINTSTLARVTVRSPLHHGFAASGTPAFSPDGTHIALFARTAALDTGGTSTLAIASTRTGAVRLVRAASLYTTEDAFWTVWLPAGHQLLTGAEASGYVVDTRTLHTRPFSFFASPSGFSAVVIAARRA